MKRNILYLGGALLSLAVLMSGCSEKLPTYSELTVDKSEVFIQADGDTPTATVNITGGNGNYKINVADKSIATATMDGTTITFNGLKNGTTTATVTDWAKHSAVIDIKVKEDFDLILDAGDQNLVLIKDEANPPAITIGILSGNGGYKVESNDEDVATVVLNPEGKIVITGLDVGFATVTVTDADGEEATLEVTVCEGELEFEDISARIWKVGETSDVQIVSGNPEYTIKSNDNPDAVTAVIEGNVIKVTANAVGDATLTIVDRMMMEESLTIHVVEGLELETYVIETFIIDNAPVEIAIGGSGDYSVTSDCPAIIATLSPDNTKIILTGKVGESVAMNQTISVTDNVLEETVTITIKTVNYNFETYGKGRWYIGGELGVPAGATVQNNKPSAGYNSILAGELRNLFGTYSVTNGYLVSFEGDLEPGAKTNPKLTRYAGGAVAEEITISDLEIAKKEDGKYWVKFREDGSDEDSYIIVWV
jgi:hypothetical protein